MKKLMILTTILMALGISTACADNDKPIAVTQLPQKAQLFIKAHFPKEKIALAKLERDFLETRYEVVFTNGSKVEFLKDGEWKEVECIDRNDHAHFFRIGNHRAQVVDKDF